MLPGCVDLASLWERGHTTDSISNVSTNLFSSLLTDLFTTLLGWELVVVTRIGDIIGGFLSIFCVDLRLFVSLFLFSVDFAVLL